MSQELNMDLTAWWNEQSFAGKELYTLQETGSLLLLPNTYLKERVIATISPENADSVVKTLTDKFSSVEARVKETEVEWLATEDKLKLADKIAHLKDYLQHANALGDFQKLATLVHDWEHTLYQLTEENYATKVKLAELAESVAASSDWKEATQALRDISDKWKLAGHVDKNRNDKLWNRIEAARKTYHDRKRHYHEEEEKDLLHKLDLKIDLVEQAEAIANSTEWKATTEVFHRLTDEWKTIGHTLNKKNEELWHRFLAAKSTFFENKRAHYNVVQQEHEHNYALKSALADKAETLRGSTEWNNTALAFASMMEEWKKIGRVSHDKSDELWKRFMDPQEQFFEARRHHNDEVKATQENNYNQKKAILERAEQIKNSSRWGETAAEMTVLMDEWKKIGHIGREHGDKMWEEFNAARRHFFARKDANRELRKQYAETQETVRKQQAEAQVSFRKQHAKDDVIKLRKELIEEEEKLADFKNAIENITPGKKAAELREHLEKLITETTRQITQLKGKFAQAQDDLKSQEPRPMETETVPQEANEINPVSSEQ